MPAKSLVLIVLLASGTVVLGAQSAPQPAPTPQAQPRMQPRGPRALAIGEQGAFPRYQRLLQELGLNEAQRASLDKLAGEHRKAAIRQRADQRIARLELEELMRAGTLDRGAIDAKIRQVADLHAAALRARVDHRVSMQQILTPEQFEKWQQMRGPFGPRATGSRMPRGDRFMRWQERGGPRWRMPMPPPAETPKPPAEPGGDALR